MICHLPMSLMTEIADLWNLHLEGFWFRLAKTDRFGEGNNKIMQLFNKNTSFHSHFFKDLGKKRFCTLQIKFLLRINIVNLIS